MRWYATATVLAAVLTVSACGTFLPNRGRFVAWAAAAHAGLYHRELGRWPADARELASLPCPRLDEARDFEIDPPPPAAPCDFIATLPYRIEMRPRPADLEMSFRDANGRDVCKLRVAAAVGDEITRRVTIRTTTFACPGEGDSW